MNNNLKYTKGPLRYQEAIYGDEENNYIVNDEVDIISEDGKIIAYTLKKEDALLYSCAPEMLETLIKYYKIIFTPYGSKFDLCEIKMSEAKELIEKATGLTIKEVFNDM